MDEADLESDEQTEECVPKKKKKPEMVDLGKTHSAQGPCVWNCDAGWFLNRKRR